VECGRSSGKDGRMEAHKKVNARRGRHSNLRAMGQKKENGQRGRKKERTKEPRSKSAIKSMLRGIRSLSPNKSPKHRRPKNGPHTGAEEEPPPSSPGRKQTPQRKIKLLTALRIVRSLSPVPVGRVSVSKTPAGDDDKEVISGAIEEVGASPPELPRPPPSPARSAAAPTPQPTDPGQTRDEQITGSSVRLRTIIQECAAPKYPQQPAPSSSPPPHKQSTGSPDTSYVTVLPPTPSLSFDSNAVTAAPTPCSEEPTFAYDATLAPFLEEQDDDDYDDELELLLLRKEDGIKVLDPCFAALDDLKLCDRYCTEQETKGGAEEAWRSEEICRKTHRQTWEEARALFGAQHTQAMPVDGEECSGATTRYPFPTSFTEERVYAPLGTPANPRTKRRAMPGPTRGPEILPHPELSRAGDWFADAASCCSASTDTSFIGVETEACPRPKHQGVRRSRRPV